MVPVISSTRCRIKDIENRIPFKRIEILFITLLIIWTNGIAQQKLSYPDLVNRLVDLEHLAVLPDKGEMSGQWLSYNRSKRNDETSGKNIQREAKADGNGYIRMEGDKYVLAEMEGPGVITRIWTALPGEGRVMIFLDGGEKPVLNYSFSDLFRLWGRRFQNLVFQTGRSLNFMIPIPYQKSCRIVAEKNWGEICQFGFTSFEKGTMLATFKSELGKDELGILEKVDNILGKKGQPPGELRKDIQTEIKKLTINPGETLTIFKEIGSRAITSLKVSLESGILIPTTLLRQGTLEASSNMGKVRELPDTPEDRDVLRELLMAIYWDKEKEPSVLTPLGDFFGSAPGWNSFRTFLTGMTQDHFYSHWFMPFNNGAHITLRNDGLKARTLSFEITHAPLTKPANQYGRLHVKWHREKYLQDNAYKKGSDWTALETTGRGRFCGSVIDIYNPKVIDWSESDFKFVIDKEISSSMSGRGLDVFYGTWGNQFYSEAFQAHSITDRSMIYRERESLNRWHIADNIPFQKSLKINFQKLFPLSDSVLYTTTMFWYLAENQKDSYTKMPIEDRVGYPRILSEFGVTNCIEGEDMEIIACTGGQTTALYVEGLHTGGWSGKRGKQQLWWNRINTGDTLILAMPVETETEYKLRIQFIKGIGYGNFKICMDDRPIDESLDLSNPELSPSDLLDFGLHKLNKGTHTLMIVALNKPTNSDGLQFGLDYIQLEPWDGTRGSQLKKHHVVAGDFTNFFNQFNINDHCFIQDNDGIWHFYGIGGRRGFAHGTSDNLRNIGWKQADYPFPAEWNPWKEMHLWAPHIIKHNDLYYMFYCAGGKTGATYRMHLATSADHQNWTRHEENPLFIDGFDARDPMVLKVGDVWVMYYCANTDPRGGNHVVAYRLSKDLVHWGERNIAFIDPRIHKSGGGTESPFVVRRGDMYYLFIGPREGYVGTDIFASKNPFQWHLEDRVGHINSHAAEVVRDKDGKWYVSHSGVGEGGLYLAPIFWNDGLDEADSSIPIPERKN